MKAAGVKWIMKFQFTPLREGRRCPKCRSMSPINEISIHAPPRGATALATCLAGSGHISIHAPPRGATKWDAAKAFLTAKFQFTPLREGRRLLPHTRCGSMGISIHAPPRGATHRFRLRGKGYDISIHAPPRGATSSGAHAPRRRPFQFTPLREGRLR